MKVQDRESSTWLVTGGNRGIGLAFGRELARRGERVVAPARNPEKAAELEKTGARVERLDVSDAESIAGLAARLGRTPIDVLIHNAGRGGGASAIAKVDPVELAAFFAINNIG